MNNLVYERLSELFKNLSFDITEGSKNNALILAISKGINDVYSYLDDVFSTLFVNTATGSELSRFLEMINVLYTDDETAKSDIIERFSMPFGEFSYTEFESALDKVSQEITYTINGDNMTFSNVEFEILFSFSRFMKEWVAPFIKVKLDGSGKSFENWDAQGLSFYELDRLLLPFSILDSI